MAGMQFSTEWVIHRLRDGEVQSSRERTTSEICRNLEISAQTFYRNWGQARYCWRDSRGGEDESVRSWEGGGCAHRRNINPENEKGDQRDVAIE